VRFPGVHAVATTPAQRLSASSARFLSRISLPDKGDSVGPRIGIFEDCSAFIHITACTLVGSPKVIRYIEGFSHFVTSMTAPTTSGWNICRVGFTPTGKRRLLTAHTRSGHSVDEGPPGRSLMSEPPPQGARGGLPDHVRRAAKIRLCYAVRCLSAFGRMEQ
jgi:hypothetical protein